MTTPLDPVTLEVIHHALMSFIKEMRYTIVRTSFGSNLRERHDFSCALQAPDGELIAIYQDNPPHIVPTVYAVKATVNRFGDDVHAGDIVMTNDPYSLGGHMNDTAHLYPIFEAGRLVFWIVIRVHYTDIGGMAPGSITPDATEVYQEGLRLPPVKAYHAGQPNEAFLDTFFANVRMPEERKGDFTAVIASFWTGEKRLREILAAHGVERVVECGRIIRDRAEHRMRQAIAALPPGTYAYEGNLDSDGFEARWIPIRVKVTIAGDAMSVDFSESADTVRGPMNGAPSTAVCAAHVALKALLDPGTAINGGSFRPISVTTRPGSLFQAELPAPTCGSQDLMHRATAVVLGAMARAVPEAALGDHCTPGHHYMAGRDPAEGRTFIMYDSPIGGTGAVSEHDGNDVLAGFERGDHGRIMSVEVHEMEFPFLAEFSELRADSGGAGRSRGGLGIRRGWRMLRGEGTVTDMAEPSLTPYYGLFGAHGGAANTTVIHRGGERLAPAAQSGKVVRFPIRQGDLVQILKWGAGGYGDPLEREPGLVLDDVREGYVSAARAEALYGVIVRDGGIDIRATAERRDALRAARLYLEVIAGPPDAEPNQARTWALAPATARRLDVADGDLVECLTAGSAALRGHARLVRDQRADAVPLGPFAQLALDLSPGKRVWIRKVFNPMDHESDGDHG